jgi:hypothetical protein
MCKVTKVEKHKSEELVKLDCWKVMGHLYKLDRLNQMNLFPVHHWPHKKLYKGVILKQRKSKGA